MSMKAKNFKCDKCDAAFPKSRDLIRHKARIRPCDPILEPESLSEESKKKPHKCKFCNRTFSLKTNLIRHIRQNCKIAPRNGDTSGMDKLFEYTFKKQEEAYKAEIAKLKAEFAAHLGNASESKELIAIPGGSVSIGENKMIQVN